MKYFRLFVSTIVCCVMLVSVLPAQAQTGCGGPAFRLNIGSFAQVLPGPANNLRVQPTLSSVVLTQIPGNAFFEVIGGPICSDGFSYWEVNYVDANGVIWTGWTAESDSQQYYVQPTANVTPLPVPSPTPGINIGVTPPSIAYDLETMTSDLIYVGGPSESQPNSFSLGAGSTQVGTVGFVNDVRLEDGSFHDSVFRLVPGVAPNAPAPTGFAGMIFGVTNQSPIAQGMRFRLRAGFQRENRSEDSALLKIGYALTPPQGQTPQINTFATYTLAYDGELTSVDLDLSPLANTGVAFLTMYVVDTNLNYATPVILLNPRVEIIGDGSGQNVGGGCPVWEEFLGASGLEWYEGDNTRTRVAIDPDTYTINLFNVPTTQTNPISWGTLQELEFRNVVIEAAMYSSQFTQSSEMGIWTRYQDGNNFLSFAINSDGQFRIARYENAYADLVPWTFSPAINRGDNAVNVLRIEERDGNWSLMINNQLVGTAFDDTWTEGRVGFYGATPNRPANFYLDRITVCGTDVSLG